MFLIGETTNKVINGKLSLPKEYHLKKRELLGKWAGENVLYISDSEKSLNFAAGKENASQKIKVDNDDRIEVPRKFENALAEIKGCITSIEITFHKKNEQ
ncbi:MAG: hypothetical protein ACFWTJ_11500 [Lachnoclostridium sp.]|jgi:hypothetical protein